MHSRVHVARRFLREFPALRSKQEDPSEAQSNNQTNSNSQSFTHQEGKGRTKVEFQNQFNSSYNVHPRNRLMYNAREVQLHIEGDDDLCDRLALRWDTFQTPFDYLPHTVGKLRMDRAGRATTAQPRLNPYEHALVEDRSSPSEHLRERKLH